LENTDILQLVKMESFPADDSDFLPVDLFQTHRQVILHRRCIDPFDEPKIERVLSEIQADEFILIGVGAEDTVKATALYNHRQISLGFHLDSFFS
jgi:hypothetical protein